MKKLLVIVFITILLIYFVTGCWQQQNNIEDAEVYEEFEDDDDSYTVETFDLTKDTFFVEYDDTFSFHIDTDRDKIYMLDVGEVLSIPRNFQFIRDQVNDNIKSIDIEQIKESLGFDYLEPTNIDMKNGIIFCIASIYSDDNQQIVLLLDLDGNVIKELKIRDKDEYFLIEEIYFTDEWAIVKGDPFNLEDIAYKKANLETGEVINYSPKKFPEIAKKENIYSDSIFDVKFLLGDCAIYNWSDNFSELCTVIETDEGEQYTIPFSYRGFYNCIIENNNVFYLISLIHEGEYAYGVVKFDINKFLELKEEYRFSYKANSLVNEEKTFWTSGELISVFKQDKIDFDIEKIYKLGNQIYLSGDEYLDEGVVVYNLENNETTDLLKYKEYIDFGDLELKGQAIFHFDDENFYQICIKGNDIIFVNKNMLKEK